MLRKTHQIINGKINNFKSAASELEMTECNNNINWKYSWVYCKMISYKYKLLWGGRDFLSRVDCYLGRNMVSYIKGERLKKQTKHNFE